MCEGYFPFILKILKFYQDMPGDVQKYRIVYLYIEIIYRNIELFYRNVEFYQDMPGISW